MDKDRRGIIALNQQELQDIAWALMCAIENTLDTEGDKMNRLNRLYSRVSESINEGPHSGKR